jgi:hypothetical protein
MAVVLTDAQLDFLARTISWKFDCDLRDTGDSVVITGDGVDDLDRLLYLIDHTPRIRVAADVGAQFSQYVYVSRDDVQALKDRYIAIYGTVDKPSLTTRPGGAAEV